MSDDDPAYVRKLRTETGSDRALDGGAVAAGLCFGVLATFVAIAGPIPGRVSLAVTTLCLLAGGVVAGYLGSDARGALQGIVVVAATAGMMAAVAVSSRFGAVSPQRVPLVFVYEALSPLAFALLVAVSGLAGAIAGECGVRLRG